MGMVAESIVRLRFSTASLAGELERDVVKIAREAGVKGGAAMGAGMKVALLGSLAVTAGVAAAFVAATKSAGNFEASMVKLTSTAGETGTMVKGNLKIVQQGILEMATSTGTSTKQLADGMYLVESAGFHGAAGLTVLKASAQGARAEQADMAVVTNAVTSALKSYNLGSDSSVMITNQMIAAVGHGKTTFQEFSGSLSTVLPLASAVGLSFAEVSGAIATMTNHGTSAREATQQLAFTIRALQAPNRQAVLEMERLGLSSTDVAQHLGERGLTGTLKLLTETVAHHMGPQGLVLIDTLNKSASAAKDASIMINSMPANLRKLATEFLNGSITIDQWHQGIKGIPADQAAMVKQFATLVSHTTGFNDLLKKGGPAAQTMADAIKKMTGGANGLNTTLMLTGGNLVSFEGNVAAVAEAGKNAGKDIEGWGAIQQTFNFKMGAFKGQIEAAKIALGQGLLPVVGNMVTAAGQVIAPLTQWMSTHQQLSAIILASVGGLSTLVITAYAFAKALAVVKVAMVALKVATLEEDGALMANPIGIVVLALVALGIAIYEAWQHSATFRVVLIDTWHAIQAAVKFAWEDVIKPVVTAMVWFWQNILGPVVMWLWHYVIYPAWQAIGLIISVAWAIMKPIFAFIHGAIQVLGVIFMWFWHHIIEPVWQGIQIRISIAWAIIQVIFGLIQIVIKITVLEFQFLWAIVKAVWAGIMGAIQVAWIFIKPIWDSLVAVIKIVIIPIFKSLWDKVKDAFTGVRIIIETVWGIIKPIFELLGGIIMDRVEPGFKAGVHALGVAWKAIEDMAKAPVKFVVKTVLNDGLLGAYNWIASKFGVKPDNVHVDLPKNFDAGGYTGDGSKYQVAGVVHAGEFVIPKSTVDEYGPGYFSRYMPGYDGGGLVGFLKSGWNAITDPVKWLKDKAMGLLDHIPGGRWIADQAIGAGKSLIGGAVEWLKKQISSLFGGSGNWPSSPAAQRGDSGVWRNIVKLVDASGIPHSFGNAYRAGDPLWHGSGRAVDWMGFNQDALANFFMQRIGSVLELIHRSNSRDYAVTRGVNKGSFNEALMEQHRNHLHIAMDTGYGRLAPGRNIVDNNTGRVETIMSTEDIPALLQQIVDAIERVAPGVGAEINSAGRSVVRIARSA